MKMDLLILNPFGGNSYSNTGDSSCTPYIGNSHANRDYTRFISCPKRKTLSRSYLILLVL